MRFKLNLILYINLLMAFVYSGGWQDIHAQNAPVTSLATIDNAISGQQVVMPVTVTGFNTIGSFTLTIDYDYTKLHFVAGNENPLLSGIFNMGDNDLGSGTHRIMMGWFGSGASLPDGSWLVNLTFSYISGSPVLEWYETGQTCEYTDVNNNILNDIPTSSYYINGRICATLPDPGPVSGSNSICQGYSGVAYSIPPIANVIGYTWMVPQGAAIVSGINTNSILVDYSAAALSGNINVCGVNECGNGPVSLLPVTVNALPLANAGNDTVIGYGTSTQLHASSGGPGNILYHWTPENLLLDPNVQNPQTLQLSSSTIFHLDVTNSSTLCQSADEMSISISGGPVTANPASVPSSICRDQNAQLFANAGGGSGNYSYSWTSVPPGVPAWTSNLQNPVVSPDSTRHYLLTVSDGFNTTSGSTDLLVHQLPSAVVSGGGSVCDDGSIAAIRIDLSGTPPWSFVYSNGLNSTSVYNQVTTPYFINTSVPGIYSVLSLNDQDCSGTSAGNAVVEVLPVPPTPVIIQTGESLVSNAAAGNQWYLNGIAIAGATAPAYTPVENGQYYSIVTLNGCNSDTSNILEVLITGYEITAENIVSIYPNPATDNVTLKLERITEKSLKLTLLTSTGVQVQSLTYSGNETGSEININTKALATGVYFLKINIGSTYFIKKIHILRS